MLKFSPTSLPTCCLWPLGSFYNTFRILREDVHHSDRRQCQHVVLSDGAFFTITITIVAEVILMIVDSFTIVCFPLMNLLILLVVLRSSVLSLHSSIFRRWWEWKLHHMLVVQKAYWVSCKQILHVAYVLHYCPLLVSTNLLSMPKQRQTSIIAPSRGCNLFYFITLGNLRNDVASIFIVVSSNCQYPLIVMWPNNWQIDAIENGRIVWSSCDG